MMLTTQQRRCMLAIQYLSREGVGPTFTELRNALGLASNSGIYRLLEALEERGFIRRLKERARAIEILRRISDGEPNPYSVEAISELPQDALEGLDAVVRTVLATRLRDRVLASPAGSAPALERGRAG